MEEVSACTCCRLYTHPHWNPCSIQTRDLTTISAGSQNIYFHMTGHVHILHTFFDNVGTSKVVDYILKSVKSLYLSAELMRIRDGTELRAASFSVTLRMFISWEGNF